MPYLFATLSSNAAPWVQSSGQSESLDDLLGSFLHRYRFACSKKANRHFSKWRLGEILSEVGQMKRRAPELTG